MGMSLLIAGNPAPFEQIKAECERTADMVLRRHSETFKWSLKLIRNEAATTEQYNALPLFDEDSIRELTWTRREASETINQVTVKFANAALLYEQDSVTIRNDANIAMTGRVRPLIVEYMAVTDRALALKIAARELRAGGLQLGNGSGKVNRKAWSLERGDCIRLNNTKHGLSGIVVRVSDVDLGEPTDNEITVSLVEDVFAFNADFTIEDDVDDLPPSVPPIRQPPVVTNSAQTQTADTGTLTITIFDPDKTIEAIRFRTQVGGAAPGSWDEVATGTPGVDQLGGQYAYDVALSSAGASIIAYEIQYKQDYAAATPSYLRSAVSFAALSTPVISLIYSLSAGIPTVTAIVPPSITSVKFAASYTYPGPTDAAVRAATPDTSAPFQETFGAIPEGLTLYVAAFGYTATGAESNKAIATIQNGASSGSPSQGANAQITQLGGVVVHDIAAGDALIAMLGGVAVHDLPANNALVSELGGVVVHDLPDNTALVAMVGAVVVHDP
jgi:hypothetical protein